MKSYLRLTLAFCLFVLVGCQKEFTGDIINTPNTQAPTNGTDTTNNQTGDYTYYYQATIGGKSYRAVVTETNGYEAGSGASGMDNVIVGGGVNLVDTTKTGTSFGISKGTLTNYLSLTDAQFKAFFNPGTYPYSKEAVAGVAVDWMDETGKHWSTSEGTGDQTGSIFKITAVKETNALNGYYVDVTAEFSCKLYDAAGNVKTLTNGKAVVAIGKI